MRSHPDIPGARGLTWRRRASHYVAYWQCRTDIAKRGYPVKSQRLWPPSADPQCAFTAEWEAYIRSECNRLQGDMLEWASGGLIGSEPVFNGSLHSLIDCYQRDPDSSFHKLRFASRRSYSSHLQALDFQLGERLLQKITGRDFIRWYAEWVGEVSRTTAAARMTMLRILFRFGNSMHVGKVECERLRSEIRDMRFAGGRPRREQLTADQVVAIRRVAHAHGRPSIALAQALQFELMLRPKDVIGEWIPVAEPGMSDVVSHGSKWLHGAHWREISDLVLTHRLSKSLHGRDAVLDPEAGKRKRYDLRLSPMVMEELAHVPPERRTGPLIVNERSGLPYTGDTFRELWRQIATEAGVPRSVQNRDSRAGGVTEAEAATGDRSMAQKAAGHSQIETTAIYVRDEDEATAKVARLRAAHRRTEEDK